MSAPDAVIVGGGIIGGAIAFELARQKLRVVLLDRQHPGLEASWAAAGILAPSPETQDAVPLVPLGRASMELYPAFVAAVEEASGRHVAFEQKGTLHAWFGAEAQEKLSAYLALHHRLGLETQALSPEEARKLEPALNPAARAAALLPYEGCVDNRALTWAVLAAARAQRAEIRSGVTVTSAGIEQNRSTGVTAGAEFIPAGHVVIAAGCYTSQLAPLAGYAPTRPMRGQMAALRSAQVRLARVLGSERGYVVPREDGRLVVGSTIEDAGYEKAITPAGMQRILGTALELVPEVADAVVLETWSGLRPDTPDHLPILGPTDIAGLWIATGHYRNGILLAPITARLMREWITEGRTSLPVEAFSPLRFLKQKQKAFGQ